MLPKGYTIGSPVSEEDFKQYYKLRFEVLRKPWGQIKGSETDHSDQNAIHAWIKDNDHVIAVCRLHFNSDTQAQIRYMGVDENYRGYGLGSIILKWLEQIAKEKNATHIILDAREKAIPFYEKQGYVILKKTYLLFGEIQHFLMEKRI